MPESMKKALQAEKIFEHKKLYKNHCLFQFKKEIAKKIQNPIFFYRTKCVYRERSELLSWAIANVYLFLSILMVKYIVIEWIHGSGKSSVAKQLTQTLKEKWINVGYYHFPNEEEDLGKMIRKTLTDKDLYKHREVLGLLYAAASNSFHIKTRDDDKIYVLERDSVTTGLVFQRDIPRETRLEIYKFGIENLRKQGIVFYVKIDKAIALERLMKRNEELKKQWGVREDKANDKFVEEEFDRLSNLYDTEMMPQLDKLWLKHEIADNSDTLENTIQQIIEKLWV